MFQLKCVSWHVSAVNPSCMWRNFRGHIQELSLCGPAWYGCHNCSSTPLWYYTWGRPNFLPPSQNDYWLILSFTGKATGYDVPGVTGVTWVTSIGIGVGWDGLWGSGAVPVACPDGGGGGISIVMVLTLLNNLGRSPAPTLATASSNNHQPSASIWCPSATVLTADKIK